VQLQQSYIRLDLGDAAELADLSCHLAVPVSAVSVGINAAC